MIDLALRRSSFILAVLLAACGDNGGTSAGVTDSNSGESESSGTTNATTSTSNGTSNSTQPTDGGTMGQTDSMGTTSPTSTSTTSESMTGTSTTMGVDTTTTDATATSTSTTTTTEGTTTTTTTEGTTTSTTTEGTTTEGTTTSTTTNTTGEPDPCACPDIEVPLDDGIFVLSDDSELWKFYPETNQFTMLGAFNCAGMTSTFSMAVDRLGYAWVMFNTPAGEIWKIDVTDPMNCIDPGYNPNQMGIGYFGMAFVSNSESDQCDSLYGNSFDGIGTFSEGPGIGDFLNVDPQSLLVDIISPSDFNGAEMTGTGDGRVFSFGGVPSKLIERDKVSGQVLSTFPLANLPLTNAFAFSFFAGDFYFFTEANGIVSKVTHLDYDDSDNDGMQELTTVVPMAPIRIVGAGVSTCAPFVPM